MKKIPYRRYLKPWPLRLGWDWGMIKVMGKRRSGQWQFRILLWFVRLDIVHRWPHYDPAFDPEYMVQQVETGFKVLWIPRHFQPGAAVSARQWIKVMPPERTFIAPSPIP